MALIYRSSLMLKAIAKKLLLSPLRIAAVGRTINIKGNKVKEERSNTQNKAKKIKNNNFTRGKIEKKTMIFLPTVVDKPKGMHNRVKNDIKFMILIHE